MSSSRHANLRCSCCGQISVVRLSNSRGNTETVRCWFTRPRVGIMMRMTLRHVREFVNLQFQRNIRARVHSSHEEWNSSCSALSKERARPICIHWVTACLWGHFTPDDDPGALSERKEVVG